MLLTVLMFELVFGGFTQGASSGGSASPLTTKGDLYTRSTVDARLPVGGDGLCLKADSATATGLAWGTCGGAGSGTSFEQAVAVTTEGVFFRQAVSLPAATATSKFTCQPFGTAADGLTPEVIAIAQLDVTVSDLVAGVGLNVNVYSPRGLSGTVRVHCTTGG